jgi:hypothetical protein
MLSQKLLWFILSCKIMKKLNSEVFFEVLYISLSGCDHDNFVTDDTADNNIEILSVV